MFYLNFTFLQHIKSSDLLTVIAVYLAFAAYVWSIKKEFNYWNSLLSSFSTELMNHEPWVNGSYPKDTFSDKASYLPSTRRRPISFIVLDEIIRKGVGGLKNFPPGLIDNLVKYNQALKTYNTVLKDEQILSTDNPYNSQKLENGFRKIADDNNISPSEFQEQIDALERKDTQLYGLAKRLFWTRKILHEGIIGDINRLDGLFYLYTEITKKFNIFLTKFEADKPWLITGSGITLVILLGLNAFILIEFYLR